MKLTNFSNTRDTMGSAGDLARDLGDDGIRNLLSMICEAYVELCNRPNKHKITPTMDEIDITEELYVELQIVWRHRGNTDIVPIHEKPDHSNRKKRGKPPSIDFCFRDRLNGESYFGCECKLLKEDNTGYKQYVSQGVNRYLEGKYNKKCSCGSMIGYITVGDIGKIINEVKIKVDEVSDISKMDESHPINGFTEHYESKHTRHINASLFTVHHLFFSFN